MSAGSRRLTPRTAQSDSVGTTLNCFGRCFMSKHPIRFGPAIAGAVLAISLLGAAPVLAAGGTPGKAERPKQSPSAEAMIMDGLILRPLGIAATAVGTGVFLATLPFTALGGNTGQAGRKLVADPAKYTFGRCLGCISKDQFPYKDNPQ